MIDWMRVQALRDEIGEEGFAEVVSLFLDEADEVVARIAGEGAEATLAADLHFLRGSALNLGFEALARLCDAGERMAPAEVDRARIAAVYLETVALFRATIDRPGAQRDAG
jgi:HPt (histidine-containing phosphotransfer) domain-containing protein